MHFYFLFNIYRALFLLFLPLLLTAQLICVNCCVICVSFQTFLVINPLNAELNPICHLPTLLGAHHILHFSGVRIKLKFGPPTNRGLIIIKTKVISLCHHAQTNNGVGRTSPLTLSAAGAVYPWQKRLADPNQ